MSGQDDRAWNRILGDEKKSDQTYREPSAYEQLGERIARSSGREQEQFARAALIGMNIPVRNFIIPLPNGKTPYLQRFILDEGDKLLKNEDRSKVYLHIIYESDGDRDPHDHPFNFESTIVWGSYREQKYRRACEPCATIYTGDVVECRNCKKPLSADADYRPRTYKAGDLNSMQAHHLHKLEIVDGPVVTLVKRGAQDPPVGFPDRPGLGAGRELHRPEVPRGATDGGRLARE